MKAFITGTSAGLGCALVQELLARGDTVFGVSRNSPPDFILHNTLYKHFPLDLSSIDQSNLLTMAADLPVIDLLICSAGFYPRKCCYFDNTFSDISYAIGLNLLSPMLIVHSLGHLLASGSTLLFINSVTSRYSIEHEILYSVSKNALNIFSSLIRSELSPRGVRVISVFPGGINTDMQKANPERAKLMNAGQLARLIINNLSSEYVFPEYTIHDPFEWFI